MTRDTLSHNSALNRQPVFPIDNVKLRALGEIGRAVKLGNPGALGEMARRSGAGARACAGAGARARAYVWKYSATVLGIDPIVKLGNPGERGRRGGLGKVAFPIGRGRACMCGRGCACACIRMEIFGYASLAYVWKYSASA